MSILAPNVSVAPKSRNTSSPASGLTGRFKDLASSDPYQELPRERTIWDKLVNWFGFRSGYDRAQEQYNLASSEYQAQLAQLSSEEQYNSPEEQARRMRQAGLNPDLTGVEGESASEFDNQQESPDVSADAPIGVIGDIGSTVLSAISGTVGILNDVNLLKRTKIAVDSDDLDFADKLFEFFKKSSSYMTDHNEEPFTGFVGALGEKDPTIFHSSRMAKRFNKFSEGAKNSLLGLTQSFKNYDDFAKTAESLGTSMSQPWFNGFGSFSAQDIADFLKPISRAQIDLLLAQIRASNAEAYRNLHKDTVEGKAYEQLDADGFSDDLAKSIKAGTQADTALSGIGVAQASENLAGTRAQNSVNQMVITRNKIYEGMIKQIANIPERGLGSRLLKFILTRELSKSINNNQSAVSGLTDNVANVAKAVGAIAK